MTVHLHRTLRRWLLAALPLVVSLLASAAVGAVIVRWAGESPARVAAVLLREVVLSPQGWGYTLYHATPLVFTGLAVALPFRAGLFNIGGEGQLYVGAFLCALTGIYLEGLPGWILLPLCVLAAALGGALWGAVPGVLKAYRGGHEVINTIMMNFIGIAGINYLVVNHLKDPRIMTPQTQEIARAAWLPRLGGWLRPLGLSIPDTNPLNASLLVALVAAVGVWFLLGRTVSGFEIRSVGQGPGAAVCGGVATPRIIILSMALGGALAGLVGVDFILGYKHLFRQNFASGLGFMGIAVALLGRNRVGGILAAALLFGALSRGGLVIDLDTRVPRDVIQVVQAVMILLMVTLGELVRSRWLPALERPPVLEPPPTDPREGGGS